MSFISSIFNQSDRAKNGSAEIFLEAEAPYLPKCTGFVRYHVAESSLIFSSRHLSKQIEALLGARQDTLGVAGPAFLRWLTERDEVLRLAVDIPFHFPHLKFDPSDFLETIPFHIECGECCFVGQPQENGPARSPEKIVQGTSLYEQLNIHCPNGHIVYTKLVRIGGVAPA